ncbi:MAG: helix-turn-helix transcriptional regulator [Bacillota bacterium]
MPITFPLVGREHEMALLRTHLAAAEAGTGGLVLIGGEAGAGKSALAAHLLSEARSARVAAGRCPGPGETPPFGPVLEILTALGTPEGNPETLLEAGREQTARQLAAALLAHLRQLGTPALLLVEDIHWSDLATLDVLRHLTPLLPQSRVLLLATYRSDELNREHPLWSLLPGLQRSGADRLLLERLDYESVVELVQAVLPEGGEQRDLAQRLYQRTGGHPLFVCELLAAAQRSGAAQGLEQLPETVLQAIDLKLKRLSPECQGLLAVAALIGERFEYNLLAAVAGQPEDRLADALEESLSLRLVRSEGAQGEVFAFEHALVREALLSRMIAPRRRRWHVAIAEALIRTPQPDPDAVAFHLSRGDDPRAVEWLLAAGDRALKLGALAQARQLYERALQLLQGPDRRRGELLLKLGCSVPHHDKELAMQFWAEAMESAREAGDQPVLVWTQHMLQRERFKQYNADSIDEMATLQAQQEALLEDARYLKLESDLFGQACGYARIAGERARALGMVGRTQEAHAVIAAVQATVRPGPNLADLVYAQVPSALWNGDIEKMVEVFRQVQEYRIQLRQYRLAASMAFNRLYGLLYYRTDQVGVIDATARELDELERMAMERSGDGTTPGGYSPLGIYQFIRGDWAAARRNLLEYYRRFPDEDRILRRIPAAEMALAVGDLELSRSLLSLFRPHSPGEGPGPHIIVNDLELHVAWADWYMAQGDRKMARAWVESADRWATHLGATLWRGPIERARAKLLFLEGDGEGAYATIQAALQNRRLGEPVYWQIGGLRLAGEIAAALGQWQEAETNLRQSLELAQRCRVPYEAALTQLALGSLLPGLPDTRELLTAARESLAHLGAAPALREAEAALERLHGGGATPAQSSDGLTDREREIVCLVAQGCTDKEIAAQLFISRRTVDRHLRNIFLKLDITSRTALGAYAVRKGLLS